MHAKGSLYQLKNKPNNQNQQNLGIVFCFPPPTMKMRGQGNLSLSLQRRYARPKRHGKGISACVRNLTTRVQWNTGSMCTFAKPSLPCPPISPEISIGYQPTAATPKPSNSSASASSNMVKANSTARTGPRPRRQVRAFYFFAVAWRERSAHVLDGDPQGRDGPLTHGQDAPATLKSTVICF